MELMMNNWKSGNIPKSIDQYGYNHQIWTDIDLAKFAFMAFVVGIVVGVLF
jgi:hypothetical protein